MNRRASNYASLLESTSEARLRAARSILPRLFSVYQPASVVDVGCGYGAWLAVARELGVDQILGIDGGYGDLSNLLIPPDRFVAADLSRPFDLGLHFDLAMSLETAEHLPRSSADGFVASICAVAPVVLFSAAIPGQGGVYHHNEQWPWYWCEKFSRHGFRMFDPIRHEIRAEHQISWWYRQNTVLYVQADLVTPDSPWSQMPELTADDDLALVHRSLLEEPGLRYSLKAASQIPGAALRSVRRRLTR